MNSLDKSEQMVVDRIPFLRLFPNVIWSYLSLFTPKELFKLCEDLQLPYHYVQAIDTSDFDRSGTFYNLKHYQGIFRLKSSYSVKSLIITHSLRSALLKFRRRNLDSLGLYRSLRIIELSNFNQKLEFLRGLINLSEIKMNNF